MFYKLSDKYTEVLCGIQIGYDSPHSPQKCLQWAHAVQNSSIQLAGYVSGYLLSFTLFIYISLGGNLANFVFVTELCTAGTAED